MNFSKKFQKKFIYTKSNNLLAILFGYYNFYFYICTEMLILPSQQGR